MGKKLISVLSVCLLLCLLGITACAGRSHCISDADGQDGSIQGYAGTIDVHGEAVEESLRMSEGKEIILPQAEIDMAEDFYISSGCGEDEAEKLAVKYVKEINALYQEAVANGYTVSEQEIREQLEQLKSQYQTAENKEEIRAFIDKFENEQAYWDFQFEMYKKDLPIQKYNADREQVFIEEKQDSFERERGFAVSPEEKLEIQEEWADMFGEEKEALVKEYEYTIK